MPTTRPAALSRSPPRQGFPACPAPAVGIVLRFYALDVGLGFVTHCFLNLIILLVCFYALDVGLGFVTTSGSGQQPGQTRFYALDVGLGFVTMGYTSAFNLGWFLCPRCRAGVCDTHAKAWRDLIAEGFYALDVGLGFVTRTSASYKTALSSFYALDVGLTFVTDAFRRCL